MKEITWEFKGDVETVVMDNDGWYSLCEGYLEPEKILADEEQIKKVLEARDTLESFFGALEDQDFYEEC